MTLTVLASEVRYVNIARLLLEHGASVNAWDNSRDTPLLGALECGRLRLELARGCTPACCRTAFQVASELQSDRRLATNAILFRRRYWDRCVTAKEQQTIIA